MIFHPSVITDEWRSEYIQIPYDCDYKHWGLTISEFVEKEENSKIHIVP